MNIEKRYQMQVEMNTNLRKENEQLKTENQRLQAELEKVILASGDKDLEAIASELQKIYDKFKAALSEIKKKQKEMEHELKLARKERAKYTKKMERLMNRIQHEQNIELVPETAEESGKE